MLLFIDWQPNEVLFHIGHFSVRWYSLMWVLGLLLAYLLVQHIYKRQGIDPAPPDRHGQRQSTGKFDPLLFYCFLGVLAGARLGHCLFYEPGYYLGSVQHFVEMLLPIHFDAPGTWQWHFTGYAGLASHGAVCGLLLALWLYCRHFSLKFILVLDIIGVVAPITSACIRLGNLMNSEIIGMPTTLPWGFVFHTSDAMVNGQLVPRHPAQLYEALFYLLVFALTWTLYHRRQPDRSRLGTGFYFGLCLASIFLFRFCIEFLKEVQGGTDDGSTLLDVGQLLSIPLALVGVWCMLGMPGVRRKTEQSASQAKGPKS